MIRRVKEKKNRRKPEKKGKCRALYRLFGCENPSESLRRNNRVQATWSEQGTYIPSHRTGQMQGLKMPESAARSTRKPGHSPRLNAKHAGTTTPQKDSPGLSRGTTCVLAGTRHIKAFWNKLHRVLKSPASQSNDILNGNKWSSCRVILSAFETK